MSEEDTPITFDADYVKELRSEAAKYRNKAKDLEGQLKKYSSLEGQITEMKIENELVRRGVQADPSWIKLNDGQQISEAVDSFLEKYPQFAPFSVNEEEEAPRRKTYPQALPTDPGNAGVPGPPAKGPFSGRDIDSVKEDPKARSQLRDHYRQLLAASSNQKD